MGRGTRLYPYRCLQDKLAAFKTGQKKRSKETPKVCDDISMSKRTLSPEAQAFVTHLLEVTYTGVGELIYRPMYDENSVLITFINCPEGRRNCADGENNRLSVIVEGFERTDGKVKLSVLVRSHRTAERLRGMTGMKASVCSSLSDYIRQLAKLEPYYHCGQK